MIPGNGDEPLVAAGNIGDLDVAARSCLATRVLHL